MRRRRLIIAVAVLLFLAGILAVWWTLADWPSPRLILRHGLPSSQGPTGRKVELGHLQFVELAPGYFLRGQHTFCHSGTTLGSVCARLGLPLGDQPHHSGVDCPLDWVEFEGGFWICTQEIDPDLILATTPIDLLQSDSHPSQVLRAVLSRRHQRTIRAPTPDEWEYALKTGAITDRSTLLYLSVKRSSLPARQLVFSSGTN